MKTLSDLLIQELNDLYSAAIFLRNILKAMSSAATGKKLKELFDTYYNQAIYQVKILDKYLRDNAQIDQHHICYAMEQLADEGRASLEYKGSANIRDVALLLIIQKMKHYEITAIGSANAHAELLNYEEIRDLLMSLKKKIAEEEQRPVLLAKDLLLDPSPELKNEIIALLSRQLYAHIQEAKTLLVLFEDLFNQSQSAPLKDAIKTYNQQQISANEKLEVILENLPSTTQTEGWVQRKGMIRESTEILSKIEDPHLKDCAIILLMQRIQHIHIALYEFEGMLASHLKDGKMEGQFKSLLKQEKSSDQSFTALAEGSLFKSGINSQLQKD